MLEPLNNGWEQRGTRSYFHYCGAAVNQHRTRGWVALTVCGDLQPSNASAHDAMQWVENYDPLFWSYGDLQSIGDFAGICFTQGATNTDGNVCNVMCSLSESAKFPSHLRGLFRKHFLSKASCKKCGSRIEDIALNPVSEYDGSNKRTLITVVCACGHPVWRISQQDVFAAEHALMQAEYSFARRLRLRQSGGKHTAEEILLVSFTQQNRCIYCNRQFSEKIPFTADHLVPVTSGGTDGIVNIVLACHSCNARRGAIPFRTFCRILSLLQNQRILGHLERRLSLIRQGVTEKPDRMKEAGEFFLGISFHDPRHPRHRMILKESALARQNAATNPLLPNFLAMVPA